MLLGGFGFRTPDMGQEEIKFENTAEIKSGDIIFQITSSGQGKAVQLATRSKYSHCGIIYKEGDDYFVYEAVQPVKTTALNDWIARGEGGHYVIKRLKNAAKILTPEALGKMKDAGHKYNGKNYDTFFEWSDEKIYCSELVWKIYKEATGIELATLRKFKDFDLTSEPVKIILKERYGNKIPLDEKVISPGNIFDSDLLMTVKSN